MRILLVYFACLTGLALPVTSMSQEALALLRGTPEEVGLSSAALARIGEVFNEDIAAGKLPGAVIAVARRGKLVYLEAFGYRDREAGTSMTIDTIFNIASMTKPVTGVAALMLYDQGRLPMGDPLSKYLPQFTDQRVAVLDAAGEYVVETVPAQRPVIILDLYRHTSGIVYGRGPQAVRDLYPQGTHAAVMALSREQFLNQLSSAQLIYQPGTVWEYGFGLDLLAFVIESVAGQTYSRYLEENLFGPLGMVDTGFQLRPDQLPRYANGFFPDGDGESQQTITPILSEPLNFECGGGCLGSTANDYMRFALMLENEGILGDVRILSPKTVAYMTSDHIRNIRHDFARTNPLIADFGFGLGVAVRTQRGGAPINGAPGMFFWSGFYGTWFWIDPLEDLAVVFMGYPPAPLRQHYREVVNALVYAAILDRPNAASAN